MSTQHAAIQRIAWQALRAARGEPIRYTAGSIVVDLVAVKTRPAANQVDTADGIVYESREWDWLMDPAELVNTNGETIEPARGHKITAADGTEYKPQPSGATETVWRWSDGLHTWRRVHTEQG